MHAISWWVIVDLTDVGSIIFHLIEKKYLQWLIILTFEIFRPFAIQLITRMQTLEQMRNLEVAK